MVILVFMTDDKNVISDKHGGQKIKKKKMRLAN